MKKFAELPLIEPMYSTYHNGILTACLVKNPTIRNWYLNEVLVLECNRKFLYGYTTPNIGVVDSTLDRNPYIEVKVFPMIFLEGCLNKVIRNLIDNGYYVCFSGVDDYYVKGKSWYKERHFNHDGCICGYNQENKTYCIYAYDSNWIYQKFWTSQRSFEAGRKAMTKQGIYGNLCAIKPKGHQLEFLPKTVYSKIVAYLDSDIEKYPFEGEEKVYGIVVHEYIAEYVSKLYRGEIPYERMDRRVFRMIWEHKKIMLERVEAIERSLGFDTRFSKQYKALVAEANTMRMLYASHHMKRRDSVLPIIKDKLMDLMAKEREILTELLIEMKKVFDNETVAISKK